MRAITIREYGGPDVLEWTEVSDPEIGPGEVLIDVAASALNRADVIQRKGFYNPPPGASPYPGLECSGTIIAKADDVTDWNIGDEVCALLAGGGYAEKVAVPAGQVLPVPKGVDLVTAASLPEIACTVWSNIGMIAKLQAGETFLIHGGAGGIGTHAIQLGKALGATVAVTAGSDERLRRCAELGADITVNYRTQDFVAEVKQADVILDNMGAAYLARNVDVLAVHGRLMVIGMQGGTKAELDLGKLLVKKAMVMGTALRSRPIEEKAEIVRSVVANVWPLVESGEIKPVVQDVLPMAGANEAHRQLDEGRVFGKLLLRR
ncbi:NAD(P)H quinone oxidoreductase [Lentzea sp. NBRC 105346]|uniref:NAD(P)H-quinone oxidoreductase n=1 Tax=Lentzea sp. NBRC 105346 TaxID=3032205 RepID=UPI0024A44014|nr:NAD(P)H-quinone oxidoreductase [Lentzea sp. NBRC 105346]GLZ32525.1 NAD(P)H quinone oxidoreductase [Lentzea sp. NBRC 105346]